MTERRKYRKTPMVFEVGCENEDAERVVSGLVWILNRKGRGELVPPPQKSEEDVAEVVTTQLREK